MELVNGKREPRNVTRHSAIAAAPAHDRFGMIRMDGVDLTICVFARPTGMATESTSRFRRNQVSGRVLRRPSLLSPTQLLSVPRG
jgi:hypothetical protein